MPSPSRSTVTTRSKRLQQESDDDDGPPAASRRPPPKPARQVPKIRVSAVTKTGVVKSVIDTTTDKSDVIAGSRQKQGDQFITSTPIGRVLKMKRADVLRLKRKEGIVASSADILDSSSSGGFQAPSHTISLPPDQDVDPPGGPSAKKGRSDNDEPQRPIIRVHQVRPSDSFVRLSSLAADPDDRTEDREASTSSELLDTDLSLIQDSHAEDSALGLPFMPNFPLEHEGPEPEEDEEGVPAIPKGIVKKRTPKTPKVRQKRTMPLPLMTSSRRRSKPAIRIASTAVLAGAGKMLQATTCKVCGAYFKNEDNLEAHMDAHRAYMSETREFADEPAIPARSQLDRSCVACSLAFQSPGLLMQHKASVHGVPPMVSCTECGECFRRRGDLIAHLGEAHLELEQNQCCLCMVCPPTKPDYVQHMADVHKIALDSGIWRSPSKDAQ